MTSAPKDKELKPWEAYIPQHHWRNATDEAEGAKLGMWLFLSTEVLLFAGFFCAYAFFRLLYPENWHDASRYYLDWEIGAANTAVLLLSSFTIVLAIRAAQQGNRGMMLIHLGITQLCAAFFLIVKLGWEYWPKIRDGKLPGIFFDYPAVYAQRAAEKAMIVAPDAIIPAAQVAGDYASTFTPGAHDHIFLSIYWISTATHGFHVLVGMFVIGWAMWKAYKWHYGPRHYTSLENVGLYWHIVDIIWIFLFPLLYLV
ncbi:MAG: cytochrome c oxidase subunit 3 family protein [Phycisphaeraceae bacterium]|nr:MAG: cytochrome c oxidase subunit 3 family protein [Phycisphaeraceae bacterium]